MLVFLDTYSGFQFDMAYLSICDIVLAHKMDNGHYVSQCILGTAMVICIWLLMCVDNTQHHIIYDGTKLYQK